MTCINDMFNIASHQQVGSSFMHEGPLSEFTLQPGELEKFEAIDKFFEDPKHKAGQLSSDLKMAINRYNRYKQYQAIYKEAPSPASYTPAKEIAKGTGQKATLKGDGDFNKEANRMMKKP